MRLELYNTSTAVTAYRRADMSREAVKSGVSPHEILLKIKAAPLDHRPDSSGFSIVPRCEGRRSEEG